MYPCRLKHTTNFNPRAPRGARLISTATGTCSVLFQSTRPARGATEAKKNIADYFLKFQSTRPARGATVCRSSGGQVKMISIHAPREGRDCSLVVVGELEGGISIHAPREGRDMLVSCLLPAGVVFQSTRPARGATAKVNKFLCTFLQKRHGFQIFLRKTLPFKAFCRLQIGKNFSICGANRCGNFCELLLRTIRSSVLPEGRSACSQNAQFYSHTFSRDNRNADCLFPDP